MNAQQPMGTDIARPRTSIVSALWLLARALLWALALPGFFAFYLPWRYFGIAEVRLDLQQPAQIAGVAVFTLGAVSLAICIWEFARSGRGTLSPVDPPRRLVVRSLYRYVRNPMYLSVTLVVFGEFLLTRSTELLAYWVVWFVCVNLFVIGYEEPTLRRDFGAAYEVYTQTVPRWIPRLPPRTGPDGR